MNVEDPRETAPNLLLSAYRGQPLYEALIAGDANRVKDLYDTLVDCRALALSINDGAGEQLDRIGKIVGEPRWTDDDEQYRVTLRARVLINRSNGTAPEMIAIAALLGDTDHEEGSFVRLTEVAVAGIVVEIVRTPVLPGAEILKRLRAAKAAGVGFTLIVSPVGESTAPAFAFRFGWSSGDPAGLDADNALVWSNTMEPGGWMSWGLR